MSFLFRAGALAAAALCTACATYMAPTYSNDYEAVDRLKAASLGKVAVSPFEPLNPESPVNKPTLRGAKLASPEGTFVKYIESALARDLREAGLLSAEAPTKIAGNVLANEVNVLGSSEGTGKLDVEITVSRAGQTRLRKTYRAATRFDSAFMGTIAIQQGQAAYPALVRALLKQIYSDTEFLNAIRN